MIMSLYSILILKILRYTTVTLAGIDGHSRLVTYLLRLSYHCSWMLVENIQSHPEYDVIMVSKMLLWLGG